MTDIDEEARREKKRADAAADFFERYINELLKGTDWEFKLGDDGQEEIVCEHGVGHGLHDHTCDGCCEDWDFEEWEKG